MSTAEEQIAAAVAHLSSAEATITVGTRPGVAIMPPVKFDRLSVTRRVLGHITPEVEHTALGSRNTLAALVYSIMRDRNTTHPPAPNPALAVDGKTQEEVVTDVLGHVTRLQDAGLVEQREDDNGKTHYVVTDAGHAELAS